MKFVFYHILFDILQWDFQNWYFLIFIWFNDIEECWVDYWYCSWWRNWCFCYDCSVFFLVFGLCVFWLRSASAYFLCSERAWCFFPVVLDFCVWPGSSHEAFGGMWSRLIPLERGGMEHCFPVFSVVCNWVFRVFVGSAGVLVSLFNNQAPRQGEENTSPEPRTTASPDCCGGRWASTIDYSTYGHWLSTRFLPRPWNGWTASTFAGSAN